jgi:ATP synthase protein I
MTSSAAGYRRALGVQVAIAGGTGLVWGLFGGRDAALSALLGGAICVIPSAFFAWRLHAASRRGAAAFGAAFLAGELTKLALSAVLFAAVIRWYHDVHHAALVVGFIATLQGYLLALLVT